MFAVHTSHQTVRRAICLFFAAIIVACGLTLGIVGVQSLERSAMTATSARI